MVVQINLWVSRELAGWLMENYANDLWQDQINDREEVELARHIKPYQKSGNTARGQFGSLFPKLLYLYELPKGSKFLNPEPLGASGSLELQKRSLEPYYDCDIGADARFSDWDQMIPYPYLDVESKDYFITHNVTSTYAREDFLRVVRRQVSNISHKHCFMAEIRAYDEVMDLCYQSITVNNPKAMRNSPASKPTQVERCWHAESIRGYCSDDLNTEFPDQEWPDGDALLSPKEVAGLLRERPGASELLRNIELKEQIKWHEPFGNPYYCFIHDLLFNARGFYCGASESSPDSLFLCPFDWEQE